MIEPQLSRRAGLRVLGALAALLVTACVAGGDGEGPLPSEGKAWEIDAVSGATQRYLPFEFTDHERHAQLLGDCTRCHHPARDLARDPVSCRSCHGTPATTVGLPTAMHASCRGCHAERARLGQRSGPQTCLECHRERP